MAGIEKNRTTDPDNHGLLTCDALLCISNASMPLLDLKRYTFPVSRVDGFHWSMEESSHMFAYLGHLKTGETVITVPMRALIFIKLFSAAL